MLLSVLVSRGFLLSEWLRGIKVEDHATCYTFSDGKNNHSSYIPGNNYITAPWASMSITHKHHNQKKEENKRREEKKGYLLPKTNPFRIYFDSLSSICPTCCPCSTLPSYYTQTLSPSLLNSYPASIFNPHAMGLRLSSPRPWLLASWRSITCSLKRDPLRDMACTHLHQVNINTFIHQPPTVHPFQWLDYNYWICLPTIYHTSVHNNRLVCIPVYRIKIYTCSAQLSPQ